jgi:hypothetical protein
VDIFAGIENCSINGATVVGDADAQTVTVSNFAADGSSGVSGNFSDAAAWFQSFNADLGADGQFRWSASSDGQILGQLDVTANPDLSYNAWATFSGEDGGNSRYDVTVLDGENYVGGQKSVDAASPTHTTIAAAAAADPPILAGGGFGNNGPIYAKALQSRHSFAKMATDPTREGACEWFLEASAGNSLTVTLPDGRQFNGTKVLFTEEVTPGHVVYDHFQRIDVQGTMNSYTISSESSVPVQ